MLGMAHQHTFPVCNTSLSLLSALGPPFGRWLMCLIIRKVKTSPLIAKLLYKYMLHLCRADVPMTSTL